MLKNFQKHIVIRKIYNKNYYKIAHESKFQGEDEVIVFQENSNFSKLILNRPHRLNSININIVDIIENQLKQNNKNNLNTFFLEGAGPKAYSSGGDLRSHLTNYMNNIEDRDNIIKAVGNHNYRCFKLAYQMRENPNLVQISHLNGIVMGQGAGFGLLAPLKISTDKTLFAMPEGRIGFFADAGGSFFLTRLKKNIGMYLALTGNRLKGKQMLECGLSSHHIQEHNIQNMYRDLIECSEKFSQKLNKEELIQRYYNILNKYCVEKGKKDLNFENEDLIDEIFSVDNIDELFYNIKKYQHKEFVKDLQNSLQLQCPWSLYTNFELYSKVQKENLSLEQCVILDYRLVLKFLLRNDFFEGIRCALIDRNDKPQWEIKDINQINRQDIIKQIEEPLPDQLEQQFSNDLIKFV